MRKPNEEFDPAVHGQTLRYWVSVGKTSSPWVKGLRGSNSPAQPVKNFTTEDKIMTDNNNTHATTGFLPALAAATSQAAAHPRAPTPSAAAPAYPSRIQPPDPKRVPSDYARLAPVTWTEGIQCWRQANLDAKKFDKVLISRMTVTLKADQQKGIDPTDLKTLTDYFHNAMVKALEPQMPVVEKAGPGVLGHSHRADQSRSHRGVQKPDRNAGALRVRLRSGFRRGYGPACRVHALSRRGRHGDAVHRRRFPGRCRRVP